MLANTLYSRRMAPLYVQTVVVGLDSNGPQLFSLDMGGSLMPDDFTATGTGTAPAFGVLEDGYKPTLTVKDAEEIAINAVKAGISRDAQSGGEIRVMSVTESGVAERIVN
jgi:proteasome beta subunit